MNQLNYHHLYYFYVIGREGSVVKAANFLNLTSQTLSGQLKTFEDYLGVQLFDRKGKRLFLNESGRLVYGYAEDIFAIGSELQQVMRSKGANQQFVFTVGIVDVIPKILAFNLLSPLLNDIDGIRLVSREGDFESLLADLAINKIDLIISDRGLPPGSVIKAYNHFLGESGLTFYAEEHLKKGLDDNFPQNLDGVPFLMPGDNTSQYINLSSWFEQLNIAPIVVAEFDDSALMKFFGQQGCGVFCTPTTIENHVVSQYDVSVIGRSEEIYDRFYAISPERRLKHPAVKQVMDIASTLYD